MRSRGNGGACTMNDPNSRLMGFAVVVFDAKEFIELAVDVSSLCVLKFIYNVVCAHQILICNLFKKI